MVFLNVTSKLYNFLSVHPNTLYQSVSSLEEEKLGVRRQNYLINLPGFEIVKRTHSVEIQWERFEPNALKMQPQCAKYSGFWLKSAVFSSTKRDNNNSFKISFLVLSLPDT